MRESDFSTKGSAPDRRQPEGPEGMDDSFRWSESRRETGEIAVRDILSPEERMELAILSFAEGSKLVASGIGRRMIKNPLITALAGAGVSWLLLMGRDLRPAIFEPLTATGPMRKKLTRQQDRLVMAAGLVRERSAEMNVRLSGLAANKPFTLAAFAFSAGAALGALTLVRPGEGLAARQREYHPLTGEAATLAAHSERKSQAGGFGPEETEPALETV
jgi:hypothetical protein